MLDKVYDYEPLHFDDDNESLVTKYNMYDLDNMNEDVKIADVIKSLQMLLDSGVTTIKSHITAGSLAVPSQKIPAPQKVQNEEPVLCINFDADDNLNTLYTGYKNGRQLSRQSYNCNNILIKLRNDQIMTSSFMRGFLERAMSKYGDTLTVDFGTYFDAPRMKKEYQWAVCDFKKHAPICKCGAHAVVVEVDIDLDQQYHEPRFSYKKLSSLCCKCSHTFITDEQQIKNNNARELVRMRMNMNNR